jgi:hypothetical protein
MDYTLSPSIRKDPYHAHLLHSQLTKHLTDLFPLVNQEVSLLVILSLTFDEGSFADHGYP